MYTTSACTYSFYEDKQLALWLEKKKAPLLWLSVLGLFSEKEPENGNVLGLWRATRTINKKLIGLKPVRQGVFYIHRLPVLLSRLPFGHTFNGFDHLLVYHGV